MTLACWCLQEFRTSPLSPFAQSSHSIDWAPSWQPCTLLALVLPLTASFQACAMVYKWAMGLERSPSQLEGRRRRVMADRSRRHRSVPTEPHDRNRRHPGIYTSSPPDLFTMAALTPWVEIGQPGRHHVYLRAPHSFITSAYIHSVPFVTELLVRSNILPYPLTLCPRVHSN